MIADDENLGPEGFIVKESAGWRVTGEEQVDAARVSVEPLIIVAIDGHRYRSAHQAFAGRGPKASFPSISTPRVAERARQAPTSSGVIWQPPSPAKHRYPDGRHGDWAPKIAMPEQGAAKAPRKPGASLPGMISV